MTDFQAPIWGLCGKNVHDISLEVIKAGSVIDQISFPENKPYQIAGRMKQSCDLHFNHPSISRTHAVFQFNEQGKLFLMDLKSTHGTFVNKKRILPEKFYDLNVGDLLRFGDSTRLYAVCGPTELLPSERKRFQNDKIETVIKVKDDKYASWGFGDDAVEEESDDSDSSETEKSDKKASFFAHFGTHQEEFEQDCMPKDLNEKEKRDWKGIQRRKLKKQHLQQEIDRIQAKQFQLNGGLSTGQVQAMERNESHIQRLDKEIEELEAKLRVKQNQKIHQRLQLQRQDDKDGSKMNTIKGNEYASDEDDFYDRTKANERSDAAHTNKPLQQMPLTSADIQKNILQLKETLLAVEQQRQSYLDQNKNEDCDDNTEATDALDAYMDLTKQKMASDTLEKLSQKEIEIKQKLDQQRRLLSIATPAIASLPISTLAEKNGSPAEKSNAVPVAVISVEKKQQSDLPEEIPPKKRPTTDLETKVEVNGKKKAQRVNHRSSSKIGPNLPKNVQMCKSQSIQSVKKAEQSPLNSSEVLEGGEAIWIPPSDQTGNGRTILNEKYGY